MRRRFYTVGVSSTESVSIGASAAFGSQEAATTAVPTAKNSMTWLSQPWLRSRMLTLRFPRPEAWAPLPACALELGLV